MPQRTKRRLIAAGVAAATLIGTGVVIGISGSASAHRGRSVADTSVLECLPDDPGASASQQPPAASSSAPQQSSSSAAAPADPADPSASDVPPADGQDQQPPAGDAPPMDQAPDSSTPAAQGGVKPAAYQPSTDKPAPPPAANAPDEAGAPNPATPDPQPQAQTLNQFTLPSCTDALGPFPQDFVNIRTVQPSAVDARVQRTGSRGTLSSRCGTNQNGHNNPDNFIVAPGVANGAHHQHDYVGNLSTDGNSTNESLQAAGTTCQGGGDKSAYYWPVIRLRDAKGLGAADAVNPHNIGTQIRPASVSLLWRGNAVSKVVAMPLFMRIITGDAKAAVNGGANGNAKWTCTGFGNRFTTKYPLCPSGSRLERQLDFPSCWDGVNFDSANHRTHVVFPAKNGACPAGTKAVPALRMTLTYNIPARTLFAVDAFPEVQHSPITDHGDFTNVMSDAQMTKVVNCINTGKNC
jgi:hypothetical protein